MSVLIKGGRVVTASDDYVADVFVEGERVTLIGESLDARRRPDDRRTRQVRPAGLRRPAHPPRHAVRRHGHDRRRRVGADGGGVRRHDLSRRLLHPGQGADASRDALADWHAKADGKQLIDMGYHIAVTDLSAAGALDELATLPDQGVTSYKLFMAYKGALMVDDETLFRTMEVAATNGCARDGARRERRCDRRARARRARGRPHRAALARADAAARDRGRGDEPRDPARPRRRLPALRRPRLVPGGGRADRDRAREGLERLGRDLHAVLLRRLRRSSSGRTSRARSTSTRRRRATRRTRTCSGTPCAPTSLSAISTDHCAFNWDGQKTLGRDDFSKIPNGGPGLENRLQMIHHFGVRERPDHAQPDGRAARDEPGEAVRPLPAQGHARGRLRRRHRRLRPRASA